MVRSPASTDQELLLLLRKEDHAAFEAIYHRYWKKLLHYALQKITDLADAENMVQDVFLSLWKRPLELQLDGELANYLIVSVKYRIIKLLARQQYQQDYEAHQLAYGA